MQLPIMLLGLPSFLVKKYYTNLSMLCRVSKLSLNLGAQSKWCLLDVDFDEFYRSIFIAVLVPTNANFNIISCSLG